MSADLEAAFERFWQGTAADKPVDCRNSVEEFRSSVEAAQGEQGEKLRELLDRWLHGNRDVKQIKVIAKNGRYRTFCETLKALRANVRDVLRG